MARSLEELHDQLVAGIEGLVSSEQWRAMLEISARFHNYSFNNQLLIYLQCPEATRVAGYRAWQRLGRQVRKGSRGIQILAPCRRRVSRVTSEGEQDETERIEILTGFRVVHVFDVSQTSTAVLEVEEAMQEQLGSTSATIVRSQLWRPVAHASES